ncbi:glycosyltransferase family 4 protein [Empedobacter brevis]|uniref:glycosyltransferase family 4 protein n=1 Tax=Empedobacter brevis TaxID=247 RepID=UPI002FE23D20
MKNKRHILFLASWFPSKKNEFDGDFVERHAKSVALLHHVTVVYVSNLEGINEIKKEETKIGDLTIIRVYFPKKNRILNQYKKFKLYLKEVEKLTKIDLIHVNVTFPVGIVALYFKIRKKIPYVITEHWTGYLPQDPVHISFRNLYITKQIVKNASFLMPVSESLGNAMNILGLNCRIKVIRNVIDFELFQFQNLRNDNCIKFLHISNLSYQKNIEGIIKVADKLWQDGFDFQLHIGGNGELKLLESYKERSVFSDKIFLFNALTQVEVAEKMNQSDAFILFSRFENQPCVQIESFACGLPVIASDVGGVSEVFPAGFGEIIEPENEEQLYETMKSFIENKIELKKRIEIHQFAKEHFSMQKIAKQFDEIYNEVLK